MEQPPNPLRTLVTYHAILVLAIIFTVLMLLGTPTTAASESNMDQVALLGELNMDHVALGLLTMVTFVFFLLAVVSLYAYGSKALPSKSKYAYFSVAVLIEIVYIFVAVLCNAYV